MFGKTPPNTPETVSFIMRAQPGAARGLGHARGDSDLTVPEFAAAYGGDPTAIHQLQSYLAGFRISTTVDADQVNVVATGTAGEFDQALDVQQDQYHVPAQAGTGAQAGVPAQTVHGTAQTPQLPAGFASDVLAVLGLTDYAAFTSSAKHADAALHGGAKSTPTSCEKQLPNSCNLPRTSPPATALIRCMTTATTGRDRPSGSSRSPRSIRAPRSTSGRTSPISRPTGRTLTTRQRAGRTWEAEPRRQRRDRPRRRAVGRRGARCQRRRLPGGEHRRGLRRRVLPGRQRRHRRQRLHQLGGLGDLLQQNQIAKNTEPSAYLAAFDEAFLELAAQGQSTFIAAGDNGAYDASDDTTTTNLSIDSNGDSPYVTSAGGTTLAGEQTFQNANRRKSVTVDVPAERMWGWDYLWAPVAAVTPGHNLFAAVKQNVWGGGGGVSVLYPEPSYQQGASRGTTSYSAVPYLTPTEYRKGASGLVWPHKWAFNPSPPVTTGTASGRATPDLATDGDPDTGYWLYQPTAKPALENGWGGTSFDAPQLNGSAAVIDSYAGHRVGFWNPAMYAAASSSNSPFTPLDESGPENDNLYYTGTAGAVFDPGAGLGIPDLSALAATLAADSPQ